MRTLLIAALACFVSAPAFAQEEAVTWSSPQGRITYAEEDGPYGVLEYPVPFGDNVGRYYVDGLAGEFGGLGPLDGWWSEPDVSHDDDDDTTLICPFVIEDGHGRTTRNWGRIRIMFVQDDFPGDFVLLRGRCFEEPKDVVPAKLMPTLALPRPR